MSLHNVQIYLRAKSIGSFAMAQVESKPTTQRVTDAAAAMVHTLQAAGITHLFVNLGSDHPAFFTVSSSLPVR